MSDGISGLIVQHQLLIALVAIVVVAGLLIDLLPSKKGRHRWRNKTEWRRDKWQSRDSANADWRLAPKDSADQLRLVMGSHFTIRPVLNKGEARLFRELGPMVAAHNPAWQVMAQVSLGEILKCEDRQAFACVNSKRVDFLLMDGDCQPRHAIEYQGGAHYQRDAAARDAVKKEALRRAGIGYHEVVAGQMTPTELKRLVEKLVDGGIPPKEPGS
jgi:hypothetical protein